MASRLNWVAAAALAAAALVGLTIQGGAGAQPVPAAPPAQPDAPNLGADIKLAPAFTPADLSAQPTDGWITNGGTLTNQRYSPLDQINRSNVAGLKGLWRTGMKSGLEQGQSGQAQILVYGDTLYVINGANDVFAMDVETGRILWTYSAHPDPRAGSPAGHSSRGVAIGEGKVFLGAHDGRIVALDQRTGKEVWSVLGESWQDGFTITSAPLYYDGKVITGFSGGESGVRGRVKAYDAKTGKLVWTFYTIPEPGQPGSETWPKNSDAWKHGGGTVWQTPAVDPELGLLYFTTGNPGPDVHGSVRPGDNLYSVSILAIDANTGKYRWHFQQVHHDIWDYDSPNPVILFDAPYQGKMRKGIVEVGKTGFTYILDRATGKPLLGIPEKAVPQEPRLATAKTQPWPIGEAAFPQEVDIAPEGARLEPGTTHLPNYGRIFTPFFTDEVVVKPSTNGGANWPPSSYDPATHVMYQCGTDKEATYRADPAIAPPVVGKGYNGGRWGGTAMPGGGILAAVNLITNKVVWRQQWRENCFSGSVVTKGGLLFVGRADGRLIAFDKATGQSLWEFLTDGGVNTTVTTFEHKGRQMVVVHAGGGSFANGKRGDGIWMFTLDGKLATLAPPPRQFGGGPGR